MLARAMTTGRPLRRWAFTAMVTAVSVIPAASFARVFPVAGATTRTSSSPFGPMGSTDGISRRGFRPVISSRDRSSSSASPKRLSVSAAVSERMGVTVS